VTGFSIIGLVDPPGRVVEGEILYQGRNLAKIGEEELRQLRGNRIAMIFQDPMMTLNPGPARGHADDRDGAGPMRTCRARRPASEAATRSGLVGIPEPDERLKSYPHQFSGGMRSAWPSPSPAAPPELIHRDEPTRRWTSPSRADPGRGAEAGRDHRHQLIWITP
jgi:peptide/nickel transport system ATP-binding protein